MILGIGWTGQWNATFKQTKGNTTITAKQENLEATVVATVKAEPRLKMHWNGNTIVDISREFLNSNGAEKHIDIAPAKLEDYSKEIPVFFSYNMSMGVSLLCELAKTAAKVLGNDFDIEIVAKLYEKKKVYFYQEKAF